MDLALAGAPPADEWMPMSENCLSLNVWTPALGRGREAPVMFWRHRGGFFVQTPPIWWNDGANLARSGDVVVVTVSHRLGPMGYLNVASLGGPEYAHSGNVGNIDLVLALEWVRDNIATFGGDPGKLSRGEALPGHLSLPFS